MCPLTQSPEMQECTQFMGKRPYGVGMLVAGYDVSGYYNLGYATNQRTLTTTVSSCPPFSAILPQYPVVVLLCEEWLPHFNTSKRVGGGGGHLPSFICAYFLPPYFPSSAWVPTCTRPAPPPTTMTANAWPLERGPR